MLQLIPDGLNEEVAQVMMFYRWRRAPILQLLCTLRRQADSDFIVFNSDDGFPLVAMVRLGPSDEDPSATRVVFNVEYRLPNVLVEFAGKLGVHMHVDSILQQNILVRSSSRSLCCSWYARERSALCCAVTPLQARHRQHRIHAGVQEADREGADAGYPGGVV